MVGVSVVTLSVDRLVLGPWGPSDNSMKFAGEAGGGGGGVWGEEGKIPDLTQVFQGSQTKNTKCKQTIENY